MTAICDFSGIPTSTKLNLDKTWPAFLRGKTFANLVCAIGYVQEQADVYAAKHKKPDTKYPEARDRLLSLILDEVFTRTNVGSNVLLTTKVLRPTPDESLYMWMGRYHWGVWESSMKPGAVVAIKPKRTVAPKPVVESFKFEVANAISGTQDRVDAKQLMTRLIRELDLERPSACNISSHEGALHIQTATKRLAFRNAPTIKAVAPKRPRKAPASSTKGKSPKRRGPRKKTPAARSVVVEHAPVPGSPMDVGPSVAPLAVA